MDQYERTSGGTGTGGPANTPPFGSERNAISTAADHQIPEQTSPAHAASIGSGLGGSETGAAGGTSGGEGSTREEGSLSGVGAFAGGGTATQAQPATEQLSQRASDMASQAEDRLNQGMKQAAERIDTMAQRLTQVADERLSGSTGAKARVGDTAHSVADTMQSVADYLRNHDTQALRGDLERQMRERPLQTLFVAVAAGWLVGKILR